jgi:phosphoglycerol transferase MdoB-like AlkP superfamily enzyme
MGEPVLPSDFGEAGELAEVISIGQLLGLLVLPGLALAVFAANFRRRPLAMPLAGCAVVLGIALCFLVASPALSARLDARFGYTPFSNWSNFVRVGPLLFWAQETSRSRALMVTTPDRGMVAEALSGLPTVPQPAGDAPHPKRNLYVVAMESFWNPALIPDHEFSAPGMAPEMGALLAQAGSSRLLSPTFGGFTANAEFEALCGLPASSSLEFVSFLRQDMGCLPRVMAEQGWHTDAAHPNSGSFFERRTAYPRLGFQTVHFRNDFVMDELADNMLSDASLFRQQEARLRETRAATGTPLFSYVMTYASHYPYPPINGRANDITVTPEDPIAAGYANAIHRLSAATAAYIDEIRRADPDAVIVAFGDHLPNLGASKDAMRAVGFVGEESPDGPPSSWLAMTATPLLVIDGRNGVLDTGPLPAWRLPALIGGLLGVDLPPALRFDTPAGIAQIRPFRGNLLVQAANGQLAVCGGQNSPPALCEPAMTWLRRIAVIKHDLMSGSRFAGETGIAETAARE